MSEQRIITVSSRPHSRLARVREALRSFWMGPYASNSPELARLYGSPVASGVSVNEESALSYSAVWSAVGIISSQIGSLPLVLYKLQADNTGKDRYYSHPLYRILHDRPNPEMGSMIFRETLQAHVLTYGNAYAEIERDNGGRPVNLWPLTPDRVHPFRRNGTLLYRVANPGGGETILPAENTIHVPGLGFDGITGYGVIDKMRESIGLGLATERFGGAFFGNGTTFGGVFEHPTQLSEKARKNFVESINARHQGVDRAHKFIVVEEGMKYARLGVDPDHAQFLETRTFQLDEVARWLNVPPHKLKNLTRSTNNNIEHQNLEYYIDCLAPWCKRWEQELWWKLIASSERNIQTIEHVVQGLLRGDVAGRGLMYTTRFNTASATPNDIRGLEGENKIPGGDMAAWPLTHIPLHLAEAYYQAQIEKLKAPPPAPAPPPSDATKQRELDDARREAQEAVDRLSAEVLSVTEARAVADADYKRVSDLLTAERDGTVKLVEGFTNDLATARQETVAARADAEKYRGDWLVASEGLAVMEARVGELRTQITTSSGDAVLAAASLLEAREALVRQNTLYEELAVTCRSHLDAGTATAGELQTTRQRLDQATAAARAVVVDRLQQLIEIESERARRVQGSPDKLRTWLGQFYPGHDDRCREMLRSSVKAWAVCVGHPEPVEHVLDVLISQHIEQSVRQLRTVADENDTDTMPAQLEKVLRRWEADRAERLADRVLIGAT